MCMVMWSKISCGLRSLAAVTSRRLLQSCVIPTASSRRFAKFLNPLSLPSAIAKGMNTSHLGSYLNEHHSASVGALKLIAHVLTQDLPADSKEFFRQLEQEVKEDQTALEALMRKFEVHASVVGQTASWIMEELAWTKIHRASDGALGLFKACEALMLGVSGKAALWTVLKRITVDVPELSETELDQLAARSIRQRDALEAQRLRYAIDAFELHAEHADAGLAVV